MITITRLLIGGLFALMSLTAQAQTCSPNIQKTKPDSQYELLNNDTEVLDKKTGLIWQRCILGASWNGSTCSGTATYHTWEDSFAQAATMATNTGVAWRVPNIKELISLVETACFLPAINETIFPATPNFIWSSSFWSSSSAGRPFHFHHYDFEYNPWDKDYGLAVRLVRSQ
jgi:hypothetical protein